MARRTNIKYTKEMRSDIWDRYQAGDSVRSIARPFDRSSSSIHRQLALTGGIRPAVVIPRLSQSSTGKVVYTLRTPYRDGTTQVAFDRGGHPPVDFIARLAALVPKPRVNLTRYHGVLAPNHRWRGLVTPAKRSKGAKRLPNKEVASPAERHAAMTWAQRRVTQH